MDVLRNLAAFELEELCEPLTNEHGEHEENGGQSRPSRDGRRVEACGCWGGFVLYGYREREAGSQRSQR